LNHTAPTYSADFATAAASRLSRAGFLCGVVGLAVAIGLGLAEGDHMRHFWLSYLIAFAFVLTLGVGGLFFVLIQHITGAKWSVTVRRQAEFAIGTIPFLAFLALPLLVPLFSHEGVEEFGGLLWSWVHPHGDHAALITSKVPFLNVNFFVGRFVGYFLIWSLMARYFKNASIEQDKTGEHELTVRMRTRSALCLIVLALTYSFAAFDLLMSTDPAWFSTIFGVYLFGASFLAIHCFLVLSTLYYQRQGHLKKMVTIEHYHDLGKLMLAFTIFWAYIAFSQYMLYWYGNIPEETAWYLIRITSPWTNWSWIEPIGHFFIPFLGILSRHIKRKPPLLGFWAFYILVVHYIDLYWLVAPNLYPDTVPFNGVEVFALIGVVGLFLWKYGQQAKKHSLLAHRDPLISDCLAFQNY
jgi:hypothetical protein